MYTENTQPFLPAESWNLNTTSLGEEEITEEKERLVF